MLHLRRSGTKYPYLKSFLRGLSNQNTPQDVPYEKTLRNIAFDSPTEVPKEADVVIIGGGSLGCNTLYNLVKLGITNVVLLEAHSLTAGTTWHSAGLVWRPKLNAIDIELVSKTREIIVSLEDETGINPGFVKSGMLCIAKNKERFRELQRTWSLTKSLNVEGNFLDPKETKEFCPYFNVDDIYGSLYYPDEGTVEPAGLCSALARYATKEGAKIIEKCPVIDIKTEKTSLDGKQVKEVVTKFGSIKTNKVVNATGCWANNITKMVGVTIPLVPIKHAYVVTDKIPDVQNLVSAREPDSGIYIRPHGNSLVIGGYEPNPILIKEMEKDFHFGMFDFDWDVYGMYLEAGLNRIPILEKVGVKSTVCGPESFTPDHKAIMGEDPNVNGFYHCSGFSSTGIMFGGGCANQLAHWIIKGRPELDMFAYDIRRFNPSLNGDVEWTTERTHESFAKTYSLNYRHDQPLAGRNSKKSPLHNILLEKGCVFQESHGWERPGWFNSSPTPVQPYDWYGEYGNSISQDKRYKEIISGDYTYDFPVHHRNIREECLAARENAALFDMSSNGKFYLAGPDAIKAADWLFTSNMQRKSGSIISTFMLNEQGGIEGELSVSIIDEMDEFNWEPKLTYTGYYISCGGGVALQTKAHILKELRKHNWDVELCDVSDEMGVISLQGPKSWEIMNEVFKFGNSSESIPLSTPTVLRLDLSAPVRTFSKSSIGEVGYEIHVPNHSMIQVYKVLHEAGEKHKLKDCGYRALDSLSCEKGYNSWNSDIRLDDTLTEAGVHTSCKLDTSIPFLGREALSKQINEKIKKKLVTFTLKDSSVALNGLEGVQRNGESVGFIRRAEFSFHLGTSVAKGYVKRPCGSEVNEEFLTTGDWSVEVMGEKYPVTIHLEQPFDPKNKRIKVN